RHRTGFSVAGRCTGRYDSQRAALFEANSHHLREGTLKRISMTAIGLALCLCLPAWGDSPARPEVPPLVLGAESPRSFLVSGHARMSDTMALGFHVAQDGERRLVVVYDLMDQTPLFISDGRQTLAYDVANSQLVLLSSTRGCVDVQW